MSGGQRSIAVVGGGIIGLSIAWRLAKQGCSVSVYDAGVCGREASWAGAGMLAPGGEAHDDSDYAQILLASRALYSAFVRELETESGLLIDFQQSGALDLAYSDAEWDALRERAHAQRAWGVPSKEVSVPAVRAFWPRVQCERLTGALFYPHDAAINPRDVIEALRVSCAARGVVLRENDAVTSLDVGGSKVWIETRAGFRGEAAHVIVAAGAWSSAIGVSGAPTLPEAVPVRGHLIGYAQPSETCTTIIRHGHTYLLQRANGLLIAGASMEHAGFDRTIDPPTTACLVEAAGSILPHLRETTPAETWIGFRPQTAKLQVGRWHSERLLCAFGHFRNGILLAPWTAQRIAELLDK